jgi:hypothetical protein
MSGTGARIRVMFLLLRVHRDTHHHLAGGLVPWMLKVNKRLQKFSNRLAIRDPVSSDGLQPGDKRNTAKVSHSHNASCSVNRDAQRRQQIWVRGNKLMKRRAT